MGTRRRARQIAELLGFDQQNQIRIATVASEIVRNALIRCGMHVSKGCTGAGAK